jgi:hypothetical protein
MALTETTRIDKIEWVESNHIQIRTATVIERNVIWTEEIIANYQASQIREYPPLPDEESII